MDKNRLSTILFSIGASVVIVGFLLYLRGPTRYLRFEHEYLGRWPESVPPEDSKEVVWYNPKAFHAYSENLTVLTSIAISNEQVFLHVLNESQFEIWNENHTIHESVISGNLMNNQAMSFRLEEETVYHFILENHLNKTIDTQLVINLQGFFLRYDYTFVPIYLLLILVGLALSVICRSRPIRGLDSFLCEKWALQRYKPLGTRRSNHEERALRFEAYAIRKRLVKYFIVAVVFILTSIFSYDMLRVYNVATALNPARPEYTVLFFDYGVRVNILRTFWIAPLAFCVASYTLLIIPRIEDFGKIVRTKLGMKIQTKKHWRIEKFMYQKIVREVMSVHFLVFCVLLFSPVLLIEYFDLWEWISLTWGIAFVILLSIWAGFHVWSGFREACLALDIKKYARKTYVKASSVDFFVWSLVSVVFISPFVIFASSDFWRSFLHRLIIDPVLMLHRWGPEFIFGSNIELIGIQGIFLISTAFFIIGTLFFVLFPYIHREGRRGVSVALTSFLLTFLTECAVYAVFQEAQKTLLRPFALIVPLLVSFVSWIAQSRYQKIVRRMIKK